MFHLILLHPSTNIAVVSDSAKCSFLAISISLYTFCNCGPETSYLLGILKPGLSNLNTFFHSGCSTNRNDDPLVYMALHSWCCIAS